MIILKMFIILIGFHSWSAGKSQNPFMPNLPLGEYRRVIEKIYPCETTTNHSLKFNFYLSKKTANITEMKGNITFLIPFDDKYVYTFESNLMSWSLTGGWKPNSYVFIRKNGCSSAKYLVGNAWNLILNGFNFPTTSCPLPQGTYTTSGIDLEYLSDLNIPKVYFYGKYKAVNILRNLEKETLGCVTFECSLIRPWEKPI